jgi:hypothetical protein
MWDRIYQNSVLTSQEQCDFINYGFRAGIDYLSPMLENPAFKHKPEYFKEHLGI